MRRPRLLGSKGDTILCPAKIRDTVLCPLLILSMLAFLVSVGAAQTAPGHTKWAGSRVSPVHQIPLRDELNQPIIPTESSPLPFSTRFSCAPCHDYNVIKGGWHFNAAADVPPGRPGEPWIWLDERTGTQIPLSYRPWKGMWNPAALGLSNWDFTLLFGRHFPGGGVAEPSQASVTPESRWSVSGKIEINCLGCHNASHLQNPSEWAKQVLRENFRWAATAAAGLGEVGGMASRLRPTWDLFDGPNPDDSEWAVAPSIKYNKTLFDSKHKAFLDLNYKADDARCLACHSAAPAGQAKRDFDDDVHTAAGIKCAECHRHDVSHNMIRGYEGEARLNPAAAGEDFTCRGCHLGGETADGRTVMPGRMGAPRPVHKGFPEIHFKRLNCTVCHSGPLPAKETPRVHTARANRLGIFGVADWSTELPAVAESVYVRDANKKLAPNRVLWPAYWARISDQKVIPLKPVDAAAAGGDILLPEAPVIKILTRLNGLSEVDGTPVLSYGGRLYELNADGGLSSTPFPQEAKKDASTVPQVLVRKDDKLTPLIADFNPSNAEESVEPEARIQKILEGLTGMDEAPGAPALIFKNIEYRISESSLNKSERKEPPSAQPEFIWLKADRRAPLVPEFAIRTIAALAGSDQTLTEEQVELVLKALAAKAPGTYAYIADGRMFRLGKKGALEAVSDDAAAPLTWPIAHRVRPARQSLGVNGCTDCHSGSSNFFFAKTRAAGPLKTDRAVVRSAVSFMGLTKPFHKLFGLSFLVRPWFKVALGIAAFLIASLLAVLFLTMLGRAAGLIEKRR
jgi:hypothetical protein